MPKKRLTLSYPYDKKNFNPPAPVLEVSLSIPNSQLIVKLPALLDSGADITVIPQGITQQLQLKYVDEVLAIGYDGIQKKTFVYSVQIILHGLGDFIIKTITSDAEYVIIGRDILNKWSILLKGRDEVFEIS